MSIERIDNINVATIQNPNGFQIQSQNLTNANTGDMMVNSVNKLQNTLTKGISYITDIQNKKQARIDETALNMASYYMKETYDSYQPNLDNSIAAEEQNSAVSKIEQYNAGITGISDNAKEKLQLMQGTARQTLAMKQEFGSIKLAEQQNQTMTLMNIDKAAASADMKGIVAWCDNAKSKGQYNIYNKKKTFLEQGNYNRTVGGALAQDLSIQQYKTYLQGLDEVDQSGATNTDIFKDPDTGTQLTKDQVVLARREIQSKISDKKIDFINEMDAQEAEGVYITPETWEAAYKNGFITKKELQTKKTVFTDSMIKQNDDKTLDLRLNILSEKFPLDNAGKKKTFTEFNSQIESIPMEIETKKELKKILKKKFDGTTKDEDNFTLASDVMITTAVSEMKGNAQVKENDIGWVDWIPFVNPKKMVEQSAANMKLQEKALRQECAGLKDINQIQQKVDEFKTKVKKPIYMAEFNARMNGTLGVKQQQQSATPEYTSEQKQLMMLAKSLGINSNDYQKGGK